MSKAPAPSCASSLHPQAPQVSAPPASNPPWVTLELQTPPHLPAGQHRSSLGGRSSCVGHGKKHTPGGKEVLGGVGSPPPAPKNQPLSPPAKPPCALAKPGTARGVQQPERSRRQLAWKSQFFVVVFKCSKANDYKKKKKDN